MRLLERREGRDGEGEGFGHFRGLRKGKGGKEEDKEGMGSETREMRST